MSVLGLGLDLVDLARFAGVLERHGDALLRRIARPGEVKPGVAGTARVAHLAGLFAAKEAAMKALGTGWGEGVGFLQIEVARDASGAPRLRFLGRAGARAAELGVTRAHLSVTHDRGAAAAVVILEGNTP